MRHHLQLFTAQHNDWLCSLSPANHKHFGLLRADCETPAQIVASITMTASLSFSAVSQTREMSSAYSKIRISSSSVGFLQCLSWPSIFDNAANGDTKLSQFWQKLANHCVKTDVEQRWSKHTSLLELNGCVTSLQVSCIRFRTPC